MSQSRDVLKQRLLQEARQRRQLRLSALDNAPHNLADGLAFPQNFSLDCRRFIRRYRAHKGHLH